MHALYARQIELFPQTLSMVLWMPAYERELYVGLCARAG